MASTSAQRMQTFLADGVISKGMAVKIGSDNEHVAVCTASTDKSIGLAQGSSAAAGDQIEVALPGGGGKGLAQGTIAAGDLLVSHTDGKLKKASAAHDRVIAVAMQSAVVSDIFAVEVIVAQASQAQA